MTYKSFLFSINIIYKISYQVSEDTIYKSAAGFPIERCKKLIQGTGNNDRIFTTCLRVPTKDNGSGFG